MAISRKAVVFNAAAIVVAVSAVGGAIRSYLVRPAVPPCETRYGNVMSFRLEREGKLLTAADLQGRSGGRDKGLDHNVDIVRTTAAPKPVAIAVRLPAGTGTPDAIGAPAGGMTFPWEPANIRPHRAACLAYNVMLSDPFDASHDGVLPGLQGASDDSEQHFTVSPTWLRTGDAGIAFDIALKREPGQSANANPETIVESSESALVKGRWLRVNQEVILNTPEEADGIVRIWIDGKLILERTDARLRSDNAVVLTGVAARTHMLGGAKATAQADSSISISAFELMW